MRILFYLGHPAHYHLFKNVILSLKEKKHNVIVLIKKKDILQYLLEKSQIEFINIQPGGRGDSKFGIALGLLKRNWSVFWSCRKHRPDLMIGTSAEITHVGKVLNIPSIVVNEDDYDAVPLFTKFAYPWADHILAPVSCPTGPVGGEWEKKTVHYDGFHELAYLHPDFFSPTKDNLIGKIDFTRPFAIMRFAKLTAHHDEGKHGLSTKVVQSVIDILGDKYNVYITSERELESEFEPYRINFDPIHIHHALYFADMYIGDSQTMAAEAAVLGTPAVRFSDFVGKLGYLSEIEDVYNLGFGIKTFAPDELYKVVSELVRNPNTKRIWKGRREKLLKEKINVSRFIVDLIEGYPNSVKLLLDYESFQKVKN
jgi:uncharacterized protein